MESRIIADKLSKKERCIAGPTPHVQGRLPGRSTVLLRQPQDDVAVALAGAGQGPQTGEDRRIVP
jgi:hypothetical protein